MESQTYCLKCYNDVDGDNPECHCSERGVSWLIFRPDADSLPGDAGLGQFSIIDSLPENYLMIGQHRSTFWKLKSDGIYSYHYSNDQTS